MVRVACFLEMEMSPSIATSGASEVGLGRSRPIVYDPGRVR